MARSLIANGQEFQKIVSSSEEKPNVLSEQETGLRSQWDFVIQGYTAMRNNRKNGKGGGVATLVQEGMRFSVIKLGKEHKSTVIKLWTGNNKSKLL